MMLAQIEPSKGLTRPSKSSSQSQRVPAREQDMPRKTAGAEQDPGRMLMTHELSLSGPAVTGTGAAPDRANRA